MNDSQEEDPPEEDPYTLIETLQAEIVDLELENIDSSDEEELEPILKRAVATGHFAPTVYAAVDKLFAGDGSLPLPMRQRLIKAASRSLESIRIEEGNIEPWLMMLRIEHGIERHQLAQTIGVEEDTLTSVEEGRLSPEVFGEDKVAKWIRTLQADEGQAVRSLERSMAISIGGYRGTSRRDREGLPVHPFVEKVRITLNRMEPMSDEGGATMGA